MHSVLNQLQSDESLLLMYSAGELSAEDRAHVEQRLASEPQLRDQLERIGELNGSVDDVLGRLDASIRLPVSEGVAVRKVGRVMRQWQIDRMAPHAPEEPQDQLRFPWWSYPLTTAAAVLLAFLVWWGQQDGPPEMRSVARSTSEPSAAEAPFYYQGDLDDELARGLRRSLWNGFEPNGLQMDGVMASASSSEPAINDVEGIFMSPERYDGGRTQ